MELKKVAELLHTQDGQCTRDPIYVIFNRKRYYGFDTSYSDNVVWISSYDGTEEADEKKTKALNRYYERYLQEPNYWTKTGYMDIDEFVTVCFTDEAAKTYIQTNSHRLNKPYISVDTLYRNKEMIAIREHLMTLK